MLHLALWLIKNGRHFVNQWDAKEKCEEKQPAFINAGTRI